MKLFILNLLIIAVLGNNDCEIKSNTLTVQYAFKPRDARVRSINLKLGNLKFHIKDDVVELESSKEFGFSVKQYKKPDFSLLHFNASENNIWLSLDVTEAKESSIRFGIGYTYLNNTLFEFKASGNETYLLMRAIKSIEIDKRAAVTRKLCENRAVTVDHSPFIIKNPTLEDLKRTLMTPNRLPVQGYKLFGLVSGHEVALTDELVEAINYSIENEGCALHTKLAEKASSVLGAKNNKTNYLRVTFDQSDTPGFILEIWPKGHASPVHNHENTVGIIKILHGELKLEWFNPLAEVYNETPVPVKTAIFKKNDITWMKPDYYQTHRLSNENLKTSAIILQMYSHASSDEVFEESFNFILPGDGELKRFYPKSDFLLKQLRTITLEEFHTRKCSSEKKCNCKLDGTFCGHQLLSLFKGCVSDIEHDAVYACSKKTGKFTLIQNNCTFGCDESAHTTAKCRENEGITVELLTGKWTNVTGTINIREVVGQDYILFTGVISGLKKNASHGFHLHERGDDTDNCKHMGAHFDPFKTYLHGYVHSGTGHLNHLGDLGNIKANDDGVAHVNIKGFIINIKPNNLFSIRNRGIAIHEREDDLGLTNIGSSKRNGNAGPLVACGAIKSRDPNEKIIWNPENWAYSCDFQGNELLTVINTQGKDCGSICGKTKNCTHFTWTTYQNGTCLLKKGPVSRNDAHYTNDYTMICGIYSIDRRIKWKGSSAYECDFDGSDLSHRKSLARQCGDLCKGTVGCTHYTWTTFEDGTCWMKKGPITKNHAVNTGVKSMLCGINAIDWKGNSANACDFEGNNLSNKKSQTHQCGELCKETKGCTHFTWTMFEDGTCWMKKNQITKNQAVYNGDLTYVCGVI